MKVVGQHYVEAEVCERLDGKYYIGYRDRRGCPCKRLSAEIWTEFWRAVQALRNDAWSMIDEDNDSDT